MADQGNSKSEQETEDEKAQRERQAQFDELVKEKKYRPWEATSILNNRERASREKEINDQIRQKAAGRTERSASSELREADRDSGSRSSDAGRSRPIAAYEILKRETHEKQSGRQPDNKERTDKRAEQESRDAGAEVTDSKVAKQEKQSRAEGSARETERPRAPGRSLPPAGRGGGRQ